MASVATKSQDESTEGKNLKPQNRIMVYNVTVQVLDTWGRRCTHLRFLTTEEDEEIPTFVSNSKEEYNQIWGKTKVNIIHYQSYHTAFYYFTGRLQKNICGLL